jgi:shikimate kinase
VLGDGAFVDAANRELILQNGIAIWLDCPLDRAQAAVYESRRETYALADVRIVIENDIDNDRAKDAVEAILGHPILK